VCVCVFVRIPCVSLDILVLSKDIPSLLYNIRLMLGMFIYSRLDLVYKRLGFKIR